MADEHQSDGMECSPAGTAAAPPRIAATAVVEPGAVLGAGVVVGHHSVISGEAVVGASTVIGSNVIREGVTINRATEKEDGETIVGNGNYLMANSHVAHDCRVADHVIIANGTLLGGHVRVQSHASLSGAVAVHHWATIGGWSFVAGVSRVLHDIPPFMLCEGLPARPRCVNVVALRRGGFTPDAIAALTEAHRLVHRAKVGLASAREILQKQGMLLPPVVELLDFLAHQHEGRHGRARERRRAA